MKKKIMEIITFYLERDGHDRYEYAITNEIGKTMENYIKQIKTDEACKAIEFTLKYLKEKK